MHLKLSKLEPIKVCQIVGLHRWSNRPLEKFDFSMPYCSILFTDSEYITLFEMP